MEVKLLRKVPLFSGLTDSQLEALAEVAVIQRYNKGNLILMAEDEGNVLFVINKGKVKVSILSEDGREVILSILDDNDFFGEMALLDGKPRSATVTAIEETEALLLHRADFLDLLEKIPQIAAKLLEELTGRLRKADKKIESLALSKVTGRVANTLLQLAEEFGMEVSEGIMVRNRPTHQQLANMAGTTRETVSRVMKRLEKNGYIISKGKNFIISKEKDMQLDLAC